MLSALILSALAADVALAQDDECEELEGTPPGLYVTTDEGSTFLIQGDKVLEMRPGESGYAAEGKLTCIQKVPEFLDWPCSTDAANARKFSTYPLAELTDAGFDGNRLAQEVVRRYFEVPEVIEPIPNWKEGEYHAQLAYSDILQYATAEYWYLPNETRPLLDEKRPKVLQISLFVGINTVVVDNYMAEALRKQYGDQKIPVVFVFTDSNVVPISYFGPNVSLEEMAKAFHERGIKANEVPMWELGDYHLAPTAGEFQKFFDLPSTDEIEPLRYEALQAELETYGFTLKPVFVTMLEGVERLYVDDPERVATAIAMGLTHLPTVINFVEQDSHLRRCGPGTPAGSKGRISGETTPPGGATAPPSSPPPPPPEPEASDS